MIMIGAIIRNVRLNGGRLNPPSVLKIVNPGVSPHLSQRPPSWNHPPHSHLSTIILSIITIDIIFSTSLQTFLK